MSESPDLATALKLVDIAKARGFSFERTGPGEDAPVIGVRESPEWIEEIVLAGFWKPDSCIAVRKRRYSLVVPGESAVTQQISGDALTVLRAVISDWSPCAPTGRRSSATCGAPRLPAAGWAIDRSSDVTGGKAWD